MTEEKKRELRRLLEEATAAENLEIRYEHARGYIYGYELKLPLDVYRQCLQGWWMSYSIEPTWFRSNVKPHLVSEARHLHLLGFVREELEPFIEDDRIRSFSYVTEGATERSICLSVARGGNLYLDVLLEHLLKIAIVFGVEDAVSIFDRHSQPNGTQAHFQDIASIEGIQLEAEIDEFFPGVRLSTVSSQNSEHLLLKHNIHVSIFDFHSKMLDHSPSGKTLLVIDRPVFSIFHKPSFQPFEDGTRVDDLPFQLKLEGEIFTDTTVIDSFRKLFCQALSLACNSAVQVFGRGWCWAEGEHFFPGNGGVLLSHPRRPMGRAVRIGRAEIDEAIRLYEVLNEKTDLREKLQIPIDRWIRSKVPGRDVDKIIDLGIALEALYLSDIDEPTELAFRLRLHAAWYLRKNENHRKDLMKEFREIYDWRSSAVHKGKIPKKEIGTKSKKKKIPYTEEEVAAFIQRAQDLCRQSILKILEDGEFPKWNRLILGGEPDR